MSKASEPVALLSGLRVLDLCSSMGAFCGKLEYEAIAVLTHHSVNG